MDRISGISTIELAPGRRGFRGRNTLAGVRGTEVTAVFLNNVQEEQLAIIEMTDQVPSDADQAQVAKGIRSGRLNYVEPIGTNDLVAILPWADERWEGMPLRVKITNTNTGPVTFNGSAVLRPDGAPLKRYDLVAGAVVTVIDMGADYMLASNPASMTPVWMTVINASGLVTVPSTSAYFECWGGAGGGGGTVNTGALSSSGAGGEYRYGLLTGLTPGTTLAIGIGAGGAGGAAGTANNGGNGGDTTIGTLVTAKGGQGGRGITNGEQSIWPTGGSGGTGGTGEAGQDGELGIALAGGSYWVAPGGGSHGCGHTHFGVTSFGTGGSGTYPGQGGSGAVGGGGGGAGFRGQVRLLFLP